MKKEEKIDADKIIQNYKVTNVNAFTSYLREVYFDLAKRSSDPKKGIDKSTFNSYYKLPGIIGDRLFHVFNNSKTGFIDLEEFIYNMKTLFCSSFDEISKIIFKFYDFNNNGEITKEDIRIALSYVSLNIEEEKTPSKEFNYSERARSQKELEELLENCFNNEECQKNTMSYFNFVKVIENINSDIYFLILLFLYDKKPFSKIGLIEYEKQKKISNNDKVLSPTSKLVKTPSKKSSFSSCLTNLRSPNRKKTSLDTEIDKTLLYRGLKKTKTVKEKINKKILTILNTNDTDEDNSPVKIEVSRRRHQNLIKIGEKPESPKKKKVTFGNEEFKAAIGNEKVSFTSLMNKNKPSFTSMAKDNISNKKSNFKTSPNTSPHKNKHNKDNENLISLNTMNPEDEAFNFEKGDSPIHKRDKSMLIDFDNNSDYSDDEEIIKYEGYLYKYINDKFNKLWFKLLHNDLYFFKNQNDTQHKGLHNLSGVFLEELPNLNKNNKIYYGFSLTFPNKKREYYTDDKDSYKLWINSLRAATGSLTLTKDYTIGDEIGSGKFGVIKLCINKKTNIKYALKILSKKDMDSSDLELVRAEIEILKICQHPNIIKLYDIFETPEYFYIIMEYCSGGDLFSYIEKRNFKLPEKKACEIIFKLCRALYYIHSYGIVHRDLKPENILMTDDTENADIRLLDFGLSKILGPDEMCNEPYGTLSYCAPEVILGNPYNKQVDLFSVGVITYLLLSGQLPFNHKNSETEIARLTIEEEPSFKSKNWKKISEEAIDFIKGMLKKKPEERFNIKVAIKHKWFKKYFKEEVDNHTKSSTFEMYSSPINRVKGKV